MNHPRRFLLSFFLRDKLAKTQNNPSSFHRSQFAHYYFSLNISIARSDRSLIFSFHLARVKVPTLRHFRTVVDSRSFLRIELTIQKFPKLRQSASVTNLNLNSLHAISTDNNVKPYSQPPIRISFQTFAEIIVILSQVFTIKSFLILHEI